MRKILVALLALMVVFSVATGAVAAPGQAGHEVDKITFVHYRNPDVKPEGKPSGGGSAGYKLLPGGLHLPGTTDYDSDLGEDCTQAITAAVTEWNSHAGTPPLGSDVENANVLAWGDFDNDNIIAVTNIWYNTKTKEITQFTITFNGYYTWNKGTGKPGETMMDLWNIATHEFGHAIGLGDLYSTPSAELTMYGYSHEGETIKRDLAQGDINGVLKLYP